ncbi:MAG: hypothetical protein EOM52_02185 [Clostridia bacterium]|nr:hypothetical protein [Clostridia bacterium]
MARSTEGRLAYADLLRTAAMLAVITLHVSAGWLTAQPVGTADWHALNAFDSLTRWCVPVFVMLSGMFLLDPKKSLSWSDFFFRYLLRMAVALFVWGYFYVIFDHVLFGGTLSLDTLRVLLGDFLHGQLKVHLWYIPMTIGLYLMTPILRAFVRGAKQSDFHWFFLMVLLFAVLLPAVLALRPSDLVSFWLNQLQLHLVMGYVGFYVAGYYLKNYTINRLSEWIIYVLGIAGAVFTVVGTYVLSKAAGHFSGALFGYLAPGVVAMSVAVFVFFRYVLGISEERSRRQRVGKAAEVSFGVYLVHLVFLNGYQALASHFDMLTPSAPAILAVPLLVLAVFLPSYLVAWLLHKIPVVGRYLT